jgi:raffinose/stachyose/melibiose transport system substrate-binding protein
MVIPGTHKEGESFMKEKTGKIILTLLLNIVLAFPVFAGGGGDSGGTREVELRWASIWVGQDSKAPAVEALVAEFNAANAGKIKVIVDPQPDYNAYEQKVRTSLASGTTPGDIFTLILNPVTALFYESDLLMDFNTVLDPAWKDTFIPGPIEQSVWGGKLKSLPMETAVLPIWYNMDALRKAGVTAVPRTMAEFYAACDKLKISGVAPMSQMTGDTNAWTTMLWYSHLAVSLGGTNVWNKPFTDPAFVQAAEIMKRFIAEYSTPDAVGLGAGGSGGHFLAGRTAMFSNGPWYAGRADLRETPFFNSIVIEAPPPAGSTRDFMISRLQANICAANPKDEVRRNAIITFLKFLTSPANVNRITETSGAMFAIKTDYVPTDSLQKQFYDIAAKYQVTASDLDAALGPEVTLEFGQQMGNLVLGRITAQQFCEAVNAKINR